MEVIPNKCLTPHKQCSVNATRDTLVSQSSPSPSREGKGKESNAACDVADRDEISGKIRLSKWHTSHAQEACPIKIKKQLEQDQGESSGSHIDLALMHEQIKNTHLISSLMNTQKGKY